MAWADRDVHINVYKLVLLSEIFSLFIIFPNYTLLLRLVVVVIGMQLLIEEINFRQL